MSIAAWQVCCNLSKSFRFGVGVLWGLLNLIIYRLDHGLRLSADVNIIGKYILQRPSPERLE